MSQELPIACNRDPLRPGEKERQSELLAELGARLAETRELGSGFAFRFPAESLVLVAELMDIERRCCGFVRMKLEANAAEPDVWLTVEGPEGTKEVLRSELPLFS
jgi:hypothetical protein